MRARGPVGHTCPMIDSCINAVEYAVNHCEGADDLSTLLGKNGLLESIRSANEALRDWGATEEDRANGLDRAVSDLERELQEAQLQITELREELSSMESA